MKIERVICDQSTYTFVPILVSLIVSLPIGGHASTVFRDTFNDGDAEDGMPVTWTPQSAGDYDASSGDYVLTPSAKSGEFLVADVLDSNLSNASIRSLVNVTSEGGAAILTLRNQDSFDSQHYFGGIGYLADEGGTILFLGRNDMGSEVEFFGSFFVLPFDIRSDDAVIQLDVINDQLSLWGWRAGEMMPRNPQLTETDGKYLSGFMRIASTDDATTTFRYVHAADMHIPEPTSLMMTAFGIICLVGHVVLDGKRSGRDMLRILVLRDSI